MKRSEIKPGVVYAYKPGVYDPLRPVLVLEADYWRRTGRLFGEPEGVRPTFRSHADLTEEYRALGRDYRPPARFGGGDTHPDCGLLGADIEGSRNRGLRTATLAEQDGYAKQLAKIAKDRTGLIEKARVLVDGERALPGPKGARVHLLNPSWMVGEWADIVEARLAEDERRRNVEDNLDAESADRVARAQKRVEALRSLGLPGEIPDAHENCLRSWRSTSTWDRWKPPSYKGNTDRVVLSMRQVDALLTLIPDGAVWREEDVEEDGWTLRRPEYDAADDDAAEDDEDVAGSEE